MFSLNHLHFVLSIFEVRNEMPLSENELEIGFLNNCSTAVQRVGGHVHHVAS
ncbi:hypothetical protein ACJX0J_017110, partial [Zea mays]